MDRETIEKAVAATNAQLRKNNQALRKNLKRIVECSVENEKTQERMDLFEKIIFESKEPKEMFDAMIIQGRRIFSIEFVTAILPEDFACFYPYDFKIPGKRHYLEAENIIFMPEEDMAFHFSDSFEVTLRGNLKKGSPGFFPEDTLGKVRSEALVPLLAPEGGLCGVICFGSRLPDRFQEGLGARFLERLARLISLKLAAFTAARAASGA